MKSTATTQSRLNQILATLVMDAETIIMSAWDELYPVAFDPATGELHETELN